MDSEIIFTYKSTIFRPKYGLKMVQFHQIILIVLKLLLFGGEGLSQIILNFVKDPSIQLCV